MEKENSSCVEDNGRQCIQKAVGTVSYNRSSQVRFNFVMISAEPTVEGASNELMQLKIYARCGRVLAYVLVCKKSEEGIFVLFTIVELVQYVSTTRSWSCVSCSGTKSKIKAISPLITLIKLCTEFVSDAIGRNR